MNILKVAIILGPKCKLHYPGRRGQPRLIKSSIISSLMPFTPGFNLQESSYIPAVALVPQKLFKTRLDIHVAHLLHPRGFPNRDIPISLKTPS